MRTAGTAPPNKRPRISIEEQQASPAKDKTAQSLWLRRTSSSVSTAALAKHSPVFHDMFSIPQAPSPAFDTAASNFNPSCPVIYLTDSPEDLRHVLRASSLPERPSSEWRSNPYLDVTSQSPSSTYRHLRAQTPSFHVVSLWIRLGHKYQFEKLVEEGLRYLRRAYPTRLTSSHPLYSDVYKDSTPIREDRPKDYIKQSAIAVVNLARLTENHALLPLALLECCKLGETIMQGFEREDGTREHLAVEDLGRCFAVKNKLILRNVDAALKVFERARIDYEPWGEDGECYDEESCTRSLKNTRRKFSAISPTHLVRADSLLAENGEETYRSRNLCLNCSIYVGALVDKQRAKFWNAFPSKRR
ncbi:hypothetical protein DICSQDRAFT_171229 [Dichomitus squalens LYAD-421 SS1]|uniref:BTB domain-containing protein n=1 Tax=Dichomitus squalens (strain LYAD-421) TaxID=732165 RepID=R7SVP6_DICSQ|nr:uncharacterized protein DICSQDRAFT_171229 [Dichomitus squalens LYAD-421 SS1]EJF60259.1 hypothetical protein DICSQDRAFT_171229 [Dichomitus squalens LYAD-421 SS1]